MDFQSNITDVFYLYQGCRGRFTYDNGTVIEFINESNYLFGAIIFGRNLLWSEDDPFTSPIDDFELYLNNSDNARLQLFLIKHTSLTHEKVKEYKKLCRKVHYKEATPKIEFETDTPESLFWMIKNKVDCFNLIDRGMAIDMMPSCNVSVVRARKKPKKKSNRLIAYLL